MLLRTLKSLISRPTEPEKNVDQKVLGLLREKKPELAKITLTKTFKDQTPAPETLALLGEVEYHLKNTKEAERLCMDSLRSKPGLAQAHYVLSLIYYDSERYEEALAQAQYARNCAPNTARILAQLGLCCISLQNFGLARDVLRQALLLDPDNVPSLNNLGIAHHALKEFDKALYHFQRAIALDPEYSPARNNLKSLFGIDAFSSNFNNESNVLQSRLESRTDSGSVYSAVEEEETAEALEQAFDEDPADIGLAVRLIRHYLGSLKLEAARDVLQIAMAHHPIAVPLLAMAGRIAHMLGQLRAARGHYEQALEIDPDHIESLLGLCQVLRDSSLHEEALAPISRAAILDENSGTLTQLAYSQVNACRYEEALETCDRIEETHPMLAPFLQSSRAVCHAYLGHFESALHHIDEAQKLESLNPGFAVFRGLVNLQHENYTEGWEGYRYRALNEAEHMRLLPYPLWQGEDLHGKTILILAEQGLGDQVMFASCLGDLLDKQPNKVILEAHHRVEKTLARSFPQIKVFPSGQKGFDWLPKELSPDYYVPIADLARHFRRAIADFPEHTGYLLADPERVAFWKARLESVNTLPKIGFTWRGGMQQTRQVIRSLQLEELSSCLGSPQFQFVNLQYGPVQRELDAFSRAHDINIIDWPEAIADLDEFAALITALDLVITVCNTTVHYAGALGKPCWVMTPFVPEWRYGISAPRMRWYPSTRMFRQPAPGDWDAVLDAVNSALNEQSPLMKP